MILLDWYNRILDYTRKYFKKCVFFLNENNMKYCLVSKILVISSKLHLVIFSEVAQNIFFGPS